MFKSFNEGKYFYAAEFNQPARLRETLANITLPQLLKRKYHGYTSHGLTAPEIAAKKDDQECLIMLIRRAMKLGAGADSFDTALIKTVIHNQKNCFHLLMNHPELQFTSWHLLKDVVRSNCSLDTFRILLEHPKSLNIPPEELGKLVIEATTTGNANVLSVLLEHPKSLNIPPKNLGAAVQLAARGKPPCFELLITFIIQHIKQLKIPAKDCSNARKHTVTDGNPSCVSLLTKNAKKSDITPEDIGKAVIEAAIHGKTGHLRQLLEYAKELNLPPKCFNDAALWAIREGHDSCFELLVDTNKIDLDAKEDRTGMTATMLAAEKGNFILLQSLIEKGADLNITKTTGNRAISLAAQKGNFMCMALLLSVNVELSKEEIKWFKRLKHYKDELFDILANDFLHMFGVKKSNDALLMAFSDKDSALHQVFSVKMEATACSLDSGTFKKIRDVLLERKAIRRTATPSASLPHSILFKEPRNLTVPQSAPSELKIDPVMGNASSVSNCDL